MIREGTRFNKNRRHYEASKNTHMLINRAAASSPAGGLRGIQPNTNSGHGARQRKPRTAHFVRLGNRELEPILEQFARQQERALK